MANSLIQYIIIRKDLQSMGWNLGAIIAQTCHATASVIYTHREDNNVKEYLRDEDKMHKVVLGIDNGEKLNEMSVSLKNGSIDHKLWIEQPENIPTCIVVKPHAKDDVKMYFKKLKLFM